MWLLILWGLLIVTALYLFHQQTYTRFSKYGVNGPRSIPILGTMVRVIFRIEHFIENIERIYNLYPDKFVGSYEFLKPMPMIRDLELIKKITIKDFDHFANHRSVIDAECDPLFGKNLFAMKDQKWRNMRSTLSPAFTSSKIKAMVPFMMEAGDQMIAALRKQFQETSSEHIEIEVKDLATRYANDVVASCAFGLKLNSNEEVNNKFYRMGKAVTTFGFWTFLKFMGFSSLPSLMKKMKVSIISKEITDFFVELVLGTMENREVNNIIRPDMIHLLMEAKKGNLSYDVQETKDTDAGFATVEESSVGKKRNTTSWDDMDLVAQALAFFFAGFETVASVMSFLLLELAINPDIQEKLYEEIRAMHARKGEKLDYISIQSMTYTDMVVSEILRLWSPLAFTDRVCVKDYNLGKANDKAEDFILREGEGVFIPVWPIHRDPEYFPNPKKFDPERFSPENVHKIKPFTYLPFGLGPRNCIGSRFALCEVKVMVYLLVLNMEVSPGKKLQLPIRLSKETFSLKAKGGHWVQLKKRKID